MGQLDNKVALITGAGQGIGQAIALEFALEGAKVCLIDLSFKSLKQTSKLILSSSASVLLKLCDITDKKSVELMVSETVEELGRPDILINNAGKSIFGNPLEMKDEMFEECLNLNLKGAWYCSQAVLRHMVQVKSGTIVNIASIHGHNIIKGCFPYPVAKHGIVGLTKALGVEYGPFNIRVNSISPGLIESPPVLQFYQAEVDAGRAKSIEEVRNKQAELLPLKKVGQPKDVAKLAVFLASDDASFINATDIKIDGGRSVVYHD